jgi:hypothetical protein
VGYLPVSGMGWLLEQLRHELFQLRPVQRSLQHL